MRKIILTKGLVASGKTTWAEEMVRKYPNKYKNICKDNIRDMLDFSKWSGKNEKFVLKVRDSLILQALEDGYDVIISDTNLSPKHEDCVRLIAEGKAEVEVKFFDVSVEECVKRDLARPNSVGADVIYRMYNQFLFKPEVVESDSNLPEAVLVDMDGTLAKNVSRGFFDWQKVGSDLLNEHVALVVRSLKAQGLKIIILTGRDGCCEKDTREWLAKHNIEYDEFYIRPEGNTEKDTAIKERLYRENICGRFVVVGVFDDRPCMRRKWLELGLPVFGCNQECYPIEF